MHLINIKPQVRRFKDVDAPLRLVMYYDASFCTEYINRKETLLVEHSFPASAEVAMCC